MTTKADKEKLKLIQDKCQTILADLLRDEDNKYCVDCDAKGPRWASWNIGIFLCIRCAGIHRNLGVHISKVKSINLDAWNADQVAHLQQMSNSKARAVYEANLPDNFRRPQTDSALEAFVRAKYEQKKYIAREWVEPPPPAPAFDIEEEIKKEKERKKNKSKPVQHTSPKIDVEANPLPRPHSSPAGTVINVDKISKDVKKSNNSDKDNYSDLLGLDVVGSSPTGPDSPSDDFGMFVSSTTVNAQQSSGSSDGTQMTTQSETSANKKANTPDEEADFFNQKAPDNEKKLLSKESILSLYASSGGTNTQPQQQNILAGSAMPTSAYQQQQFNAYNMPQQTQQQVQAAGGGFFMPPNIGMGNVPPVSAQLGQQSLFPVTTNPFLSNSSSTSNVGQPTVTQAQLPQQLSSLQLGQVSSAPLMSNTNNWMAMNAVPNMTNTTNPAAGLINPFMPAAQMVHTGVASGNASSFANVGLNSLNTGMFVQSDMSNQWMGLTANPSLGQQASVPATTNLWQ